MAATRTPRTLRISAALFLVAVPPLFFLAYSTRQSLGRVAVMLGLAAASALVGGLCLRAAGRAAGPAGQPTQGSETKSPRDQVPVTIFVTVLWFAIGLYLFAQSNVVGGIASVIAGAFSGALVVALRRRANG